MVRRQTFKNQEETQVATSIRKVFRKLFKVLKASTVKNVKTQEKLFKYKEEFVMKELGNVEQEGELSLVHVIIDDSADALKFSQNKWTFTKSRRFINSLYKRVGNEQNVALILKIFNKMIKFDSISFLRQSLAKPILQSLQKIHTYEMETRYEFEKTLSIQEIV